MPQVNGFQLSLDPQGNQNTSPLDIILITLEAQPSPLTSITGLVPGADGGQFAMSSDGKFAPVVQKLPVEGPQKLDGKELDEAVKQQISGAGLQVAPWAE